MAAKGAFPIKLESNLHGFIHVLKSAVCEWLLLFLLLLDAAFSYFLTKFAEYCELQVPCILCSRLEHILGKEKPDFYKNLLCSNHKLEVSSLVSCHSHGKLVDIHGMCEECILSFAKNESNEETYRILVAKLGSDCLQKPLLNLDSGSAYLTTKFCSCCSKPWRSRPNVQKFVQSKPSTPVLKPDIPLPKSPGHGYLNRQQGLKKGKDRFSLSTTPLVLGNADLDSLSHVGYTGVKFSSESESDFSFSDDDETITLPRNLTPATNSLMYQHLEPEKGETTTPRFVESNGDLMQSVAGINLQQSIKKATSAASEFGALDDIPLASSALYSSPALLADKGDRLSLSKKFGASGFSDFISHESSLPSKSLELPARLSKDKYIENKNRELGYPGPSGQASSTNNWESIDLNGTSTNSVRKSVAFASNISSIMGARDLASDTSTDVKSSSILPKQHGKRACNGIESPEEPVAAKTSDSQIDSSASNTHSTMNGHTDDPRKVESTSSLESQIPPKSPQMERSHSLESLEEGVGEIEGESLVDQLRRQVEYDKECIKNLHQDLEEERNAAGIAASQAMAMITKLQEEKAALNMEALQYLRMMEEQAEYDVDALEKANNMVAEKEKEIQDLEAELDYFRIKYPDDFPDMDEEILFAEEAQGSYSESIEIEKS